MSWFLRSLQSNDSDSSSQPRQFQSHCPSSAPEHSPNTTPATSVKDDLSAISQTLGRQLRGVATFLAPPPSPSTATATADSSDSSSSSQAIVGIRNDLVEIGGSLRTSLSLLSNNSNKAVGEISRFASNFLRFHNPDEEEEEAGDELVDDVPGVTDDVLDFVNEMSLRPECWTDFPLPIDVTDFEMSDVQRVHATTIQQLAPNFLALREKLQKHMIAEQFWMIYFILLIPRLDEHDFELLSTPKIVKARDILLQNLAHKKNTQAENSERTLTDDSQQEDIMPSGEKATSDEITTKTQVSETLEEENIRRWLEEVEIDRETNPNAQLKLESEEDISFSDLEDDENNDSSRILAKNGQSLEIGTSSPNESSDWVRLKGSPRGKKVGYSKQRDSEGDESSDWLNIDDFD